MGTMLHLVHILRQGGPWLLFALCSTSLTAQSLFVDGALITVQNGTEVHISGDVITQGTAELRNNGTLFMDREFFHNGTGNCFGNSQGTVVLNGNFQTIGGFGTPVFNNLVLAGTGDKYLNNHIEVGGAYAAPAGVLQLNDRRFDLSARSITVRNPAPSAIQHTTGQLISETDPTIGYGTLRWNIGQPAAGSTYSIPFGNASSGDDLPVTWTITAPGSGANGWVSFSTYPTDPFGAPNNRPLPTGLTALTDMMGLENAPNVLDRWWVVDAGGYSTAPMADLSFAYRDSEWNSGNNTIVEDGLMLQDFRDGQWHYPPAMVNSGTNHLNTFAQLLRPALWTASSMLSPLPVELLIFTGERLDAEQVLLRWATATERDNAGFELWRRVEGEPDFSMVGRVDGAGQSQSMLQYTFIDPNPTEAVSYYRLRQVDTDGRSSDSPVVAVQGMRPTAALLVYPNPATDQVNVMVPEAVAGLLVLHDMSGRPVLQHYCTGAGPLERLSLHGVAPGTYLLLFTGADRPMNASARVVVAH